MDLSERKQELLHAIIRSYISTGEPVGSKTLREIESLNLSSATIRNEMSDLCEMGYLIQPHTSAGRVPTALGYRFYVETLRECAMLSEQEKRRIDSLLPDDVTQADRLIDIACGALAELTSSTALLTLPAERDATVQKIELLGLGSRTVMLVLVTSSGTVKSRVVRCDAPVSRQLIEKMNALFESNICSLPVSQITAGLLQNLLINLGMDGLSAAPILSAIADIAAEIADSSLRMWGESNLLTNRNFSAQQATSLLNYLRSGRLRELQIKPETRFTVLLGSETDEDVLSSSGMIVTTYRQGSRHGTIGIIGPDRMDYARIIPSVLYFSESLGKLLQGSLDDEF